MRYPVAAQRAEKVAKAYVKFNIDSQGKVAAVQVLNKAHVDAFFNEEISRFMNQLPVQKQTYAGTYVLPVVFELEGIGRVIKPREEGANMVYMKWIANSQPFLKRPYLHSIASYTTDL